MIGPINRKAYPLLDLLLWDTKIEVLTPERAFETYEKRWRYLDEALLSQQERTLIQTLIKNVGHGIFMPAN